MADDLKSESHASGSYRTRFVWAIAHCGGVAINGVSAHDALHPAQQTRKYARCRTDADMAQMGITASVAVMPCQGLDDAEGSAIRPE